MSFSQPVVGSTLAPLALVKHLANKILIDGKLIAPRSKKTFSVHNPATMEIIGEAAEGP